MDFVSWFRKSFPGVLIYAIPNGGWRGKKQAIDLKAEGVVAGVPDLHVPEFGLWIEMKRSKGGRVSAEQAEMHERLRAIGHDVIVAKGCADAVAKVTALRGL